MNNLKIHCKKSWKGCIDVRDYNVKNCIKENRNIEVTCDVFEGKMTLTPELLLYPDMISKNEFTSKFENKVPYKLYSYAWKPN